MAFASTCTMTHVAAVSGRPAVFQPHARPAAAGLRSFARTASVFQSGRPVVSAAPLIARRKAQSLVVHAGPGGVFKYLSDAAAAIFTVQDSTVDWEGTSAGFSGDIVHHEVPRLRALQETITAARKQLAGCVDPSAENYNPNASVDDGTCTYTFVDGDSVAYSGPIDGFVSSSIAQLVGGNFESKDKSKVDWKGTTFNYTGDIVSQRDIQRLLAFEKVVKKELEKAEEAAKK